MAISTGKSLKIAMTLNDIDTQTIAKGLKKSPSVINNLRGKDSCSNETLELLAAFFDMSVSEFIALGEGE